ncbi:hypothetical protein FN846DRAFT_889759 [Sphaerosporella brunnea]|uniref:Uncharacterized protein n=1 Tax=Sphaerosporella brunnea TaxID=1250544 RepID=A0A5J5EY66_9PEZI|nr:hypothetical protein FN846DRAFT_889759 [Sphaerosporella brunnea]
MQSDPALQAALHTYSVAVQRYKMLAELLPGTLRPSVLRRFQHRQKRWAIERRSAEVKKVIARMERQLAGLQPQVAPQLATPIVPIAPQDGLVEVNVASTAAEVMRFNSGQPRRPTVITHHARSVAPESMEAKGQGKPASFDDFTTGTKSSVVGPLKTGDSPDNAALFVFNSPPDSTLFRPASDPKNYMSHDGSEVPSTTPNIIEYEFSAAQEIDAVVRVGVVSPDAAIRMTRVVDRLKADGASPAVWKTVYTSFLQCIQEGATFPDTDSGLMSNGSN